MCSQVLLTTSDPLEADSRKHLIQFFLYTNTKIINIYHKKSSKKIVKLGHFQKFTKWSEEFHHVGPRGDHHEHSSTELFSNNLGLNTSAERCHVMADRPVQSHRNQQTRRLKITFISCRAAQHAEGIPTISTIRPRASEPPPIGCLLQWRRSRSACVCESTDGCKCTRRCLYNSHTYDSQLNPNPSDRFAEMKPAGCLPPHAPAPTDPTLTPHVLFAPVASRAEELTNFKLNALVLSERRAAATFPVWARAHLWTPGGAMTHCDITATHGQREPAASRRRWPIVSPRGSRTKYSGVRGELRGTQR